MTILILTDDQVEGLLGPMGDHTRADVADQLAQQLCGPQPRLWLLTTTFGTDEVRADDRGMQTAVFTTCALARAAAQRTVEEQLSEAAVEDGIQVPQLSWEKWERHAGSMVAVSAAPDEDGWAECDDLCASFEVNAVTVDEE